MPVVFLILILLIHITHAFTFDRIIKYREVIFSSYNWPINLDGYRIGFLSDFHSVDNNALQAVTDTLNSQNLDLLLLGGDFSAIDNRFIYHTRILSGVNTTDGIFGVAGNHDYPDLLKEAFLINGIVPLMNSGVTVNEHFFIGGTRDLWDGYDAGNIARAAEYAESNQFVLLLTHNPDITMYQSTENIDLVLAGHTHGGQINFFDLWAPYLWLSNSVTNHNQRFRRGWAYSYDSTPVFVTSGVGQYYNVPRVFARPEVVIFTMYNGSPYVPSLVNVMPTGGWWMPGFLLFWNIASFYIYAYDKKSAKRRKRRISEISLLNMAFLWGGVGSLFAMIMYSHKTKQMKFKLLVPLAIFINFATLTFFLFRVVL